VPIPTIASQAGGFDRQHRARAAIANRDKQSFKTLPCDTSAGATEVVVDDNHILPSKSFCSPLQRILATTALRVMRQLIRCRLSDIYIGVPQEMFRGDLIHRPIPSLSLRERIRSEVASTEPELPLELRPVACRDRLTEMPDVEGLVGDLGVAPTWPPISCVLLKAEEDRSRPSIVTRRSRNAASDSLAASTSGSSAAVGLVIHSGSRPRVPSSESITKCRMPAWRTARTTMTRSPTRG
jgi:hypothetical protein